MLSQRTVMIFSGLTLCIRLVSETPMSGMNIKNAQLSRFDGTRWLNVADIIRFRQDIEDILTTTFKIKERSLHFKELVNYHLNKHELPPKLHAKIVDFGVKTLITKALPHIQAVRRDKRLLVELIDTWAMTRELETSPLKIWGATDLPDHQSEVTFFEEHLKTIIQLDEFLEHIKLFLGDLLYSCPKSYAQYLECMRIVTEQHEQRTS